MKVPLPPDFHKKGNAGLIEEQENEDEKEYILLPPSTEGLIEVDDTLYFIKAVGYLCQLGRESPLLGSEHFQIGGGAVPHQ